MVARIQHTWFKRGALIAAVIVATLSMSSVNQARERSLPGLKKSKLDRVLRKALDSGDRSVKRVIVRTKAGKAGAVANLLAKHGDRIESNHRLVDAFTVTLHGEDLLGLEQLLDVDSASIDALVSAGSSLLGGVQVNALGLTASLNTPQETENLLKATLGLDDEDDYRGHDVGIAVIDSGLEEARDISGGRVGHFVDFTKSGKSGKPYDDFGHGTHVASLIGGNGDDSKVRVVSVARGKKLTYDVRPYAGIASDAKIISLKVLNGEGAGYTSSVLRALEYTIENRERLKIDIINLSLGHPIYEAPETDPLVQAVEAATRAGIVVIASAGNYGTNQETGQVGYAGITSPGNAPSAITVGARGHERHRVTPG